jgi:translation initiation factor 5B
VFQEEQRAAAAAAAAAAALEESDEAVDDWEAEDWEEEADAAPEATIAEATSTSVVPAVLVADDGAEDWEAEDWEADEVALPTALVDERPTFSDEEEEDIADAAAAAKKAATSAGEAEKSQSPKGQGRRAAAKAKLKRNTREVGSSSGAGERKGGDTSSEETGDSSDDSDDSDLDRNEIRERERAEAMSVAREARLERRRFAFQNRNPDELRSPVVCVLGHVDTGKTKLLDKIRRTNVQEGEAGGITQQIGATFFPMQNLRKQTDKLSRELGLTTKLPGLLVIDTPGHESFGNLRSRGSNLCDIAILVVDLMHGLEPQTIESLNLLRKARTPFIVALNKIDRCLDWNVSPNATVRSTLARQKDYTVQDFDSRVTKVITEFAEQGLNACLYYDNQDFNQYISLVPTSAHTGEGIPDLLTLLVQLSQRRMGKKLQIADYVTATLLEVKSIPGHGMTIDLCLLNGTLHEGDTIVVCGLTGPITTSIRALMTPQPMKELRVKGAYQHHKSIRAAMGVKIAAHNLEHAVAGTQVMVVTEEDMLEEVQDAVQGDLRDAMAALATEPEGVYVQASTLGALEALMEFFAHEQYSRLWCQYRPRAQEREML